jgi:hypothetical protein
MAISRAQIPEQIDVFQEGGGAESDSYSQLYQDISGRLNDYDTSYDKYFERLSQYAPEKPKMNIFQVASELGRGLLTTPNTGVGSAYQGLGVGFDNISQQIKAEEEMYEKQNREIAMMAANLAMQDEQKAKDFLNQIALKRIEAVNKDVDYITLEYDEVVNGVTETKRERIPDTQANAPFINDLYAKKNAREIRPATTEINMPGDNKRDTEALKNIYKNRAIYGEKAQASNATLDQVDEARFLATEVGKEGFGPLERGTLKAREFIAGIGFDDLLEDPGSIAPQKALNQLSMSFTMGIVSQTKGAISNKEMQLFIDASPTLGSTYEGYMKQLELLERLASRDSDFYKAYLAKQKELNTTDMSLYDQDIELESFAASWKRENPLFTSAERSSLEDMAAGGDGGFEGAGLDPTFDPKGFQDRINNRKVEQASKRVVGVAGVPDGSTFIMEQDGAKYYLVPGGNVNNKDDIIKVN